MAENMYAKELFSIYWNLKFFIYYFGLKDVTTLEKFIDNHGVKASSISKFVSGEREVSKKMRVEWKEIADGIKDKGYKLSNWEKFNFYKAKAAYIMQFGSEQFEKYNDPNNKEKTVSIMVSDLLDIALSKTQEEQIRFDEEKVHLIIQGLESVLVSGPNKEVGAEVRKPEKPVNDPPQNENDPYKFRRIAKKYFDKIKGKGRFEHYFTDVRSDDKRAYIDDITVTLKTAKEEAVDFETVIFPKDISPDECTSSVSLCGKGGIGKSFLILHLIDSVLKSDAPKYANIIPLYIELQTVSNEYGGDMEKAMLSEIHRFVKDDISCTTDEIAEYLHLSGNKVIVFADGMNEVVGTDERSTVAASVTDFAIRYGSRFCISSRENHVGMFNRLAGINGRFGDASVNKLNEAQIRRYLENHKCAATQLSELPYATRKLLETPQGLSMFTTLVGNDKSRIESFTSLGSLILAYSDRILKIEDRRSHPGFENSFERVLEEIAYNWVKDSAFKGKITPEQRKKLFSDTTIDLTVIFPCKDKEVTDNSFYEFTHQNFRDCYCARYLARQIQNLKLENIKEIFAEYFDLSKSGVTANDEILELTSAFVCSGDEYDKNAIQTLREAASKEEEPLVNYDYPLSRLIRIFAFRNNNCIADLDLNHLDLREVSLSGYILFKQDTSGRIISTIFTGAKVNANTFLKTGLDTASSTITKFTYKNKEYLAAFAATSVLVIDIGESQARVVRNLDSNDWVNCCCSTYKNGENVIYLGHKNGTVSEFYPHILFMEKTDDERFVKQTLAKQDLNVANKAPVQSIFNVLLGKDEYIVYSTFGGRIGAFKKYRTGSNKEISFMLDGKISDEKASMEDVLNREAANKETSDKKAICRMSYSKDLKVLLAAYHKDIYIIDCSAGPENFAPKKMSVTGMDETLEFDRDIEDIYIGKEYVFVNTGFKIAVLKINKDKTKLRFRKYIYPAGKKFGEVHYTKFSELADERNPGGVLVGIKIDDNERNPEINISDADAADETDSKKTLKRFYGIYYSEKSDRKEFVVGVGNSYDGFPTWTGVFYKLGDKNFMATVSDKRTVEVDCNGDEEFPKRVYPGAYNGVHYIDFMDEETIICGDYDGMVLCIKHRVDDDDDIDEDVWYVNDVFPLHKDWVWKCVGLDKDHFASCGYDGKLWLADTAARTTECLLNKEGEKFYDFCYDDATGTIWLVSEHKLYQAAKKDGIWQHGIEHKTSGPESKCCFRTIAVDRVTEDEERTDNTPVVFYNEGKGKRGHIAKIGYDNEGDTSFLLNEFVDLSHPDFTEKYIENGEEKTNYLFIRHMRFHNFNGKKRLIAVGNIGNTGCILVAKYGGENETDWSRMIVEYKDHIGSRINDFTVTECGGEYFIWLAHKDHTVRVFKVIVSDSSEFELSAVDDAYISGDCMVKTDDQPMCLRAYNEDVLIGLLNGDMIRASLCTVDSGMGLLRVIKTERVIRTYADLISCSEVTLTNCECEDKEELKKQLKGYFTI